MAEPEKVPRPPTPLARRFVRLLVGFGVGVALGAAPFLGKVRVPGFEPLLALLPRTLQESVLPLSAFLMGLVAVAVQFSAGSRIPRRALGRRFRLAFGGVVAGLLAFVVLHALLVVAVPLEGGETVRATVAPSRLPACGCPPELSDPACIATLSLEPGAVESCWGTTRVRLARLALALAYLVMTGGFAALIGLVLLRGETRR